MSTSKQKLFTKKGAQKHFSTKRLWEIGCWNHQAGFGRIEFSRAISPVAFTQLDGGKPHNPAGTDIILVISCQWHENGFLVLIFSHRCRSLACLLLSRAHTSEITLCSLCTQFWSFQTSLHMVICSGLIRFKTSLPAALLLRVPPDPPCHQTTPPMMYIL